MLEVSPDARFSCRTCQAPREPGKICCLVCGKRYGTRCRAVESWGGQCEDLADTEDRLRSHAGLTAYPVQVCGAHYGLLPPPWDYFDRFVRWRP
jgi:hypothetical protein